MTFLVASRLVGLVTKLEDPGLAVFSPEWSVHEKRISFSIEIPFDDRSYWLTPSILRPDGIQPP